MSSNTNPGTTMRVPIMAGQESAKSDRQSITVRIAPPKNRMDPAHRRK
jgi:hypothetical protein